MFPKDTKLTLHKIQIQYVFSWVYSCVKTEHNLQNTYLRKKIPF